MEHVKIKMCGLTRICDIETANAIKPDYIGFVFAEKSRRYASPELAAELKKKLDPKIQAVGVFANAPLELVTELLEQGIIDMPQLHGQEDTGYIRELKKRTGKPVIKAFRIDTEADVEAANASEAEYVLLDSGQGGTGTTFDWSLLQKIRRPFFLAGGLHPDNVEEAVKALHPFALDVSSGIETDGKKDSAKMFHFAEKVRLTGMEESDEA